MFLTMLGMLEILVLNLVHTHLLLKKKYSNKITFLALTLFTIIIFTTVYLLGITPGTTVKSTYVGALFVFPLYALYDAKIKKLITIMVYCWTYTLTLNAFAYGIISSIFILDQLLYRLILQTLLILITLPFVIRFSRIKFSIILQKSSKTTSNLLLILVVSIFTAIVVIRYYIHPELITFFLMLIIFLVISISTYYLVYSIVQSNLELCKANIVITKDSLTGIGNRYSLFNDMQQKIDERKVFCVLFMDLDNLKRINDIYGHNKGDDYLKGFSKIIGEVVSDNGFAYRFAGDEFVCLVNHELTNLEIEKIEYTINIEMNKLFDFNGVSIGVSSYPENGETVDELIGYADESMYGEKRSRKIRR